MNRSSTENILLSRDFLLGFVSFFFLWISFDFFILFPLFILQNGGNSVDVGIQMAIFMIPGFLTRPLAGWLIDRIGRLKILLSGSVLMVLTAFAFLPVKGDYQHIKWTIATILFLRGTSFSAFYTAFFTYIADLSTRENRARVIGYFGISGLAAHGCAPRTAEIILNHAGFPAFFIASGLLSIVSVLISLFLRETRIHTQTDGQGGYRTFKNVTFSRRNLIFLPGAFFFGYALSSFDTFGAAYFQELGKGTAGYFFLTYGCFAVLIRAVFGGLADRYTRWKLITLFFVLLGVGVSILTFDHLSGFYIISAALCGTAHGFLFPSMSAMAVDSHPPQNRGIVTSVYTGAIELGFCAGSYLLGLFADRIGFQKMFWSVCVATLLFSIYAGLVGAQESRQGSLTST